VLLAKFELGAGDRAARLTLDAEAVRLVELSGSGMFMACAGLVAGLAGAATAAPDPVRAMDTGEPAAAGLDPEISSIAPATRTAQAVDSRTLRISDTVASNVFLQKNRQPSGTSSPPMQPDDTSIRQNASNVQSAGHLVGASNQHDAW
jgi:hypothetical protein